jgi:hypothetical protein
MLVRPALSLFRRSRVQKAPGNGTADLIEALILRIGAQLVSAVVHACLLYIEEDAFFGIFVQKQLWHQRNGSTESSSAILIALIPPQPPADFQLPGLT